jgi:hypothetical protein
MSITRKAAGLVAAAVVSTAWNPAPAVAVGPCDALATRTVLVSTSQQLRSALTDARPGDTIRVANGTYAGRFSLVASGTPDKRIRICGTGAVLDGGDWTIGYGLSIKAGYVDVVGLHVTRSQKGVMVDRSSYVVLDRLEVSVTGDEGIHLRTGTHHAVVSASRVHHTGLRVASYGEGVYVGSASNNWCTYTSCQPDRSDANQVLANSFWANTAEAVDVKEGTTGTVVSNNTFDGTGSTALSWVDIKGNNALVSGNTGTVSARDGFLTEVAASGWGIGNTFTRNRANVQGPGYGVRVTTGNRVVCDNTVMEAARGYSNVTCA